MKQEISQELQFVYLCSAYPMPPEYEKRARELMDGSKTAATSAPEFASGSGNAQAMQPASGTAAPVFGTGISMKEAVRLSIVHQVYGLFAFNLRRLWPALGVASRLEADETYEAVHGLYQMADKNKIEAMRQSREVVRLQRLFANAGIPSVPFKGVVLSKILYGESTLRVATDIDLLILRKDFENAARLLSENGWHSLKDYVSTPKKTAAYEMKFHDYDFISDEGLRLELHFRVADCRQAEILTVGGATEMLSFYGADLPVYPPELLLLYLAYHGAHHGFMWMKWLADFDAHYHSGRVDLAKARVLAAEKKMSFIFEGAEGLMALAAGENSRHTVWGNELSTQMFKVMAFSNGQKDAGFRSYRQYFASELDRRGLLTDAERRRRVTPSEKDFQKFHFSDRFFFLYYIIRGPYKLWRLLHRKSRK